MCLINWGSALNLNAANDKTMFFGAVVVDTPDTFSYKDAVP